MKKIKKLQLTLKSIIKYPKIVYDINSIKSNIIFFFPHYNTGGAEEVHLDIIKSVSEQNVTCFITEQSKDSDLKSQFEKNSKLIELYRWGWKISLKKAMLKTIARKINAIPNAVIFGCNSRFFYDLIPFLSKDIRVIDLIHTFLGEYNYSMDNYSLKHVPNIHSRVVLGENQKKKQIIFYAENKIHQDLNKRIHIIHNKISTSNTIYKKDFDDQLTILFVARNSEEKRAQLFIDITKTCLELKLPFEFTMIGDFDEYFDKMGSNVTMTGKITDKLLLQFYYEKAHMVMITSKFEGFPMVLLEGMARGSVPISTNVGEIPTYLSEDKQTGFLIDNSQDELKIRTDFVKKLIFINTNREILKKYSLNVQELVKIEFNEETFTEKYQAIFRNSLN